ncbi:MAG: glycosyltransferase family 39 protein [Candidatus Zixiibacteriota bacterium]
MTQLFDDTPKYVRAADYFFGKSQSGQYDLFLVGPGYPSFLGIFFKIFGQTFWPIIFIQILLSSFTSLLIYNIAFLIFNNRLIAFIAGLISAISLTSITLASSILTETLFFFLFCLSVYQFFRSLENARWSNLVWAGIWGGLAVLVRSVASVFPLALIMISFLYPVNGKSFRRREIISKILVTVLIIFGISSIWAIRNKVIHDTFVISDTGLKAARVFLGAQVINEEQGGRTWEVDKIRDSLYESSMITINAGDYRRAQTETIDFLISSFKEYPVKYMRFYFRNIWDNATAMSSLQNELTPDHQWITNIYYPVKWGYRMPWMIILSITGFFILARHDKAKAVCLLIIMLYFAVLSGVTFWQGSRVFYPAQAAQTILAAAALIFLYDFAVLGIKKCGRLFSSNKKCAIKDSNLGPAD